jgi:hypothetical protein
MIDYGSHASIRITEHGRFPVLKLAHSRRTAGTEYEKLNRPSAGTNSSNYAPKSEANLVLRPSLDSLG